MATVNHVESSGAFRNPHKGWTVYNYRPIARPGLSFVGGPTTGVHDTALADTIYTNYFQWSDFEPTQGSFDWSGMDAYLAAWPNKRHRIGIQISNRYPDDANKEAMPAFVRSALTTTYPSNPAVREPDYLDPDFYTMWGAFLNALADRYYNPGGGLDWRDYIWAFDLSTYGPFGEWWSGYNWGDLSDPAVRATKKNTLKSFIDQWFAAFATSPVPAFFITVSDSTTSAYNSFTTYSDPQGIEYAVVTKGAHMGRRGIGDPDVPAADGLAVIQANLANRHFHGEWKSMTGLISPNQLDSGNINDWATTSASVAHALTLQSSEVGWYKNQETWQCADIPSGVPLGELPEQVNCGVGGVTSVTTYPLDKFYPGTSETLRNYYQARSGYRFYISSSTHTSSIEPGGTITLTQTWYQRGVAKLYEQFYLRCWLVAGSERVALPNSSDLNAHSWGLGPTGPHTVISTYAVPGDLPRGRTYRLQFAVTDSNGDPAMNVAIGDKVLA